MSDKMRRENNSGAGPMRVSVMTNNYFKLYHFIPIMSLRLDERILFFFFDDTSRESTEQALRAAQECLSTVQTLTYGRMTFLSVYRGLCDRPEITPIGTTAPDVERPAS